MAPRVSNGCYFDDLSFLICNNIFYFTLPFIRQQTVLDVGQGKEGKKSWKAKTNNMQYVISKNMKPICIQKSYKGNRPMYYKR